MIRSALLCLFGFAVSFLSTPWVILLCRQQNLAMDVAGESRKRHHRPVPRLGGLPILIALTLGLLVIFYMRPVRRYDWAAILIGSLLMFSLGFADDIRSIPARWKLLGQILIASLVYWMGLGINRVSYANGSWDVELGHTWGYLVTLFWLISVPNIMNLIDGFDGLAGGLGLFMSATLGIVAIFSQQLPESWFAFTMAGGLLGFLVFNFPPARIYLGDGGAYLIGFCIAALSLKSSNKGAVASVLLVTIVALGVPILDTTFAILRRALRGFPLFGSDDEHIHHRLEDLGFSKRRILLAIYGICVVLSLMALSIFWSQGRTIPIAIGVIFLMAAFAARYLHYIRSWSDASRQFRRIISRRKTVRYALLQAQLLDMEIDRCETPAQFWPIFHDTMQKVGFLETPPPTLIKAPGLPEIPTQTPTPTSQKYVTLQLKSGDQLWTLHAPGAPDTIHEWKRLANCFAPIHQKALMKWERNSL